MDQLVKVIISGNEYLVKSREGEEEVQRIAEFVNAKFREIEDHSDGLSEKKTAILAAFHIAGEYLQLLKEREELARNIEERARTLIHHIDSVAV